MKGGVEGTGGQRGDNKRPESREGGECSSTKQSRSSDENGKKFTDRQELVLLHCLGRMEFVSTFAAKIAFAVCA